MHASRLFICMLALLALSVGVAHGQTLATGGSINAVDEVFKPVTFDTPFSSTPVVIALGGHEEGDPVGVRIYDVSTTGFNVAQLEPNNAAQGGTAVDGETAPTTIHWLAVQQGQFTLGGVRFEAGLHSTTTVRAGPGAFDNSGTFDALSYGSGSFFTGASDMLLMTGVQTMNNETSIDLIGDPTNSGAALSSPWLQSAVDGGSVGQTGASIALERAEVADGASTVPGERINVAEQIGWIAVEEGIGAFADDNLNNILFEAFVAGTFQDRADNDTDTFTQTFAGVPLVTGSQMSDAGTDGGWLRRRDDMTNATTLGAFSQEDGFNDTEVAHAAEDAAIFAFSQSFTVTNVIPEPSSYLLAGLGVLTLAGFVVYRRRSGVRQSG